MSEKDIKAKIARVLKDEIEVVSYDSKWPIMFEQERDHLIKCLPGDLIRRIEHFGSTAVPGLAAKPIVDILVEVTSLEETNEKIVPILEEQGYDYFWRPSFGDNGPPFYAWFIKRNQNGKRTHHIHMIEKDFPLWDNLFFRDYLREHPEIARDYADLKFRLFKKYKNDRVAYTNAKSDFIREITTRAKSNQT